MHRLSPRRAERMAVERVSPGADRRAGDLSSRFARAFEAELAVIFVAVETGLESGAELIRTGRVPSGP